IKNDPEQRRQLISNASSWRPHWVPPEWVPWVYLINSSSLPLPSVQRLLPTCIIQ
ncbi:hypothetical protein BaRGS_00004187, partial [Batillaria attramentaria]